MWRLKFYGLFLFFWQFSVYGLFSAQTGLVDFVWISVITLLGIVLLVFSFGAKYRHEITIMILIAQGFVLGSLDKLYGFPDNTGDAGSLLELLIFFICFIYFFCFLFSSIASRNWSWVFVLVIGLVAYYFPIFDWPPILAKQYVARNMAETHFKLTGEKLNIDKKLVTKVVRNKVYGVAPFYSPPGREPRPGYYVTEYTFSEGIMISARNREVLACYDYAFFLCGGTMDAQILTIPPPILCHYLPKTIYCKIAGI